MYTTLHVVPRKHVYNILDGFALELAENLWEIFPRFLQKLLGHANDNVEVNITITRLQQS